MKTRLLGLIILASVIAITCTPKNPEDPFKPGLECGLNFGIQYLHVGNSFELKLEDYEGTPTIEWSSSRPDVATVHGGTVNAVGEGEAEITAAVIGSSPVNFICMVKVVPADWITLGVAAIHMVKVDGGSFTMGWDPTKDADNQDGVNNPPHKVTLDDYYIADMEVSTALWIVATKKNPKLGGYDHTTVRYPQVSVNYGEVDKFLTALNSLTKKSFRLPTEAEWEYAARGGAMSNNTKYAGSANLSEVGVYKGNADKYSIYMSGMLAPNELGLFDMSGGVQEMCSDYYDKYKEEDQVNPTGPSNTEDYTSVVIRGGSYAADEDACSVFRRGYVPENLGVQTVGLRLAHSAGNF